MTVPKTTSKPTTQPLTKRLSRLERRGRYSEALRLIDENWRDPVFRPSEDSGDPRDGSELLLRFGALVGFAGHLESTAGAQERSRDILMDARMRAFALADEDMAASSENYLALSYWRTGEFREAEVWLGEALARDLSETSDSRLFSHVIHLLIGLGQGLHSENIDYGHRVERHFRANADPFLVGNLYSNIGISLKNTGRTDEALTYLTLARNYFERAHHWIYQTAVENNLALLHKNLGNYSAAHSAVDAAISRYKKLRDVTREGSSLETKAQIFLSEGSQDDGLRTIERSISILRKSENHAYLAESIATKARILAASNKLAEALLSLSEAIDITRTHTGEPAAMKLVADFESVLTSAQAPVPPRAEIGSGNVELLIPASFSNESDYRGVWIHNSFLEEIGIPHGSLALVVTELPCRGEPAAVMVNETQEVACGFYDAEFGMIGLDGGDREPVMFSEDEVTVVGRIVGVCKREAGPDGRMVAEPITARG